MDKDITDNLNIQENKEKIIQQTGLTRNTLDKYYTKKSVVDLCINKIKDNINIKVDDLIIEPSAGDGSFINQIKSLSDNYLFYDIEPEHTDIIKKDFLDIDYEELKKKYKNIHIIGNPPFGRQSSSVIKFIKFTCMFSTSISFILPKSFKKDSMKKYFTKNYHLIYEHDLDQKSFLVNQKEFDVPCIFQIWIFKQTSRPVNIKLVESGYKFVKKTDNPDISFRRVGVYAGLISKEINNKSIQSHYFIKFTNNKTIDDNLKLLELIKFDINNTVGPRSISKQELIKEFNSVLI
jgi:hypothetical protein